MDKNYPEPEVDEDIVDDGPSESELRIELAKNQNEILKCLYQNISTDNFNINLDLSNVPTFALRDFWVYTAGFMSVQNFENLGFSDKDIKKVMSGTFNLKEISIEDGEKLVKQAGKRLKSGGYAQSVPLYKIQDGEYFFNKNYPVEKHGRKYTTHLITLQTDEPNFSTNRISHSTYNDEEIFTIIRNFLVHRIPYIKGSKILLFDDKDAVLITKMWLRGYSELFSRSSNTITSEKLKNKLYKELTPQGIYIENPQEVDKALSIVKDMFDEKTQNKFYRVNTFVKRRIEYFDDFYNKSFDEKTEIIAQICANNPNFLTSSSETINPAIIYNLQQLVSAELQNRGEEAIVTEDDYDSEKLQELYERHEELTKKLEDFDAKHPVIRSRFERMQNDNLMRELVKLEKDFTKQLEYLKNRSKLESSNMNLYDAASLEKLPVEVAVNIVCLLGYNSLVTSAFYEDLLANTNSIELNADQRAFFSKFDTTKLTVSHYDTKNINNPSAETKAYILYCLRNAICHGQISYTLPPVKRVLKQNFKNVILHFVADWDRTTISGTVEEFYKLFSSSPFTLAREQSIITGSHNEMVRSITKDVKSKQNNELADNSQLENDDINSSSGPSNE